MTSAFSFGGLGGLLGSQSFGFGSGSWAGEMVTVTVWKYQLGGELGVWVVCTDWGDLGEVFGGLEAFWRCVGKRGGPWWRA